MNSYILLACLTCYLSVWFREMLAVFDFIWKSDKFKRLQKQMKDWFMLFMYSLMICACCVHPLLELGIKVFNLKHPISVKLFRTAPIVIFMHRLWILSMLFLLVQCGIAQYFVITFPICLVGGEALSLYSSEIYLVIEE